MAHFQIGVTVTASCCEKIAMLRCVISMYVGSLERRCFCASSEPTQTQNNKGNMQNSKLQDCSFARLGVVSVVRKFGSDLTSKFSFGAQNLVLHHVICTYIVSLERAHLGTYYPRSQTQNNTIPVQTSKPEDGQFYQDEWRFWHISKSGSR